jgi:hypothetical protein
VKSWFYFIDSSADTPLAFASRIPAVANATISADPKLEEPGYTGSRPPVTRRNVKVSKKKLRYFHFE